MKLARLSIALTCVALVVVATHAEAKPKPKPAAPQPCHAVTDPADDANGINPGASLSAAHAGPNIDPLDILSIDLGTNKTSMIWVMRVKKLALTSPDAPTGMFWSVHFTIRKTAFTVAAHSDLVNGISYDLSYATAAGGGTAPGPLTGVFDLAHNEIRIVVPVASIATWERTPLRTKIAAIGGVTGQEILAPGMSAYAGDARTAHPTNAVDWTANDGTYTPGKSACAKSG
jgi:hypothetical protein